MSLLFLTTIALPYHAMPIHSSHANTPKKPHLQQAIICQEGPLDIIKAVADLCPAAITIADKYGDLPIHRTALQHRGGSGDGAAIISLLKGYDESTLTKQDGWGRTPLVCALESARGPMSTDAVVILATHGAMDVPTKKGLSPLDIVLSGKASKVLSEEEKMTLVELLQTKQ
jgi:hypothetical protein